MWETFTDKLVLNLSVGGISYFSTVNYYGY